jgi:BlaI family transcriptional regulator, penicillinase repressor
MSGPENLTPLQIALLRVLWKRGEARVLEVRAALARERELTASTVATLLRRLEARGLVAHRTQGRQFVYRALIDVGQARSSAVGELATHLFDGDVPALVAHLLASSELAPGDLARVRELIDDAERKQRAEDPDASD